MDTTPFRALLDTQLPFASVYFDIALNVPDGQERIDAGRSNAPADRTALDGIR